jgi:signal transduction histidine kinase
VTRLLRSFYARLSAVFLLLILALGAGGVLIAFNSASHLFDEVEQLLNREYARSIAMELQPLVAQGFAQGRVEQAIHYMMVLNPMVEIYLVGEGGRIVSYFAHPPDRLEREVVDVEPLRRFVESGGTRLVLGEDPRNAARLKPFSAAPLRMGGEQGYVYVILRGQSYDRSLEALRNSYYLRAGLAMFLLALLAAGAVGLWLFFLLTRRLRRLSRAVSAFSEGQLDERVQAGGSDELAALGRSFNEMAAAVEAGVEKLRLAERQRRDLVAGISHDLRSPLTSVRGYLETVLLKDAELTPQRRREMLSVSLRNVASFQDLVTELFDLARLESRQVAPARELFGAAELAQDVVLKLQPQAEKAGVSLGVEVDGDLPAVEADIGMIERVLSNLIENALRFTPVGGQVRVLLRRCDAGVRITVADTGAGIAATELPHVFERFYRGSRSRERPGDGAGLGLAIAREIVELHGSVLTADSRVGEGACFAFVLPAAARPV